MAVLRSSAERAIFVFVAFVLVARIMIVGDFGLGVPSLQVKVQGIQESFSDSDTAGGSSDGAASSRGEHGGGGGSSSHGGEGSAEKESPTRGGSGGSDRVRGGGGSGGSGHGGAAHAKRSRGGGSGGSGGGGSSRPKGGSSSDNADSSDGGESEDAGEVEFLADGAVKAPSVPLASSPPPPPAHRKRVVQDDEDEDPGSGRGGGRGHGRSTPGKGSRKGSSAEPHKPAARKEEGASWKVLDNLRFSDGLSLVTHKRQFISMDERTKLPVLHHWLEYTEFNESLIYNFPRELFELLPLEEPKWDYNKCAVVGNSGVVLLKEKGDEINDHEAVIRINMAPIRGFEPYVGRKTTFNVINSHNIRELLEGQRKWKPSSSEERLVMFETASHYARYHLCHPLLKKMTFAHPILLNPIFANRAHRIWVQLKYLLEKNYGTQYNRKPMSGFFSVIFALQICRKVNLYGFDSYTSTRRSYRYHYFDNVQGFTDVHSFDLAFEIYRLLEMKNLISIMT